MITKTDTLAGTAQAYRQQMRERAAAYKRLERARKRAAGGTEMTILLGKDAARALAALTKDCTKVELITQLLLDADMRRRAGRTSARQKRAAGRE